MIIKFSKHILWLPHGFSQKSRIWSWSYRGKPRVAQWFSSYYYIRLRSVFPMAEVCTVGKVYASIFSFFRKRVVNIASSLLRPILNERSGNFTSGFSAEIAMLTKLLRKYGWILPTVCTMNYIVRMYILHL